MESQVLPLFPLEVVLLPGTPLPLHIFEPRYKQMIGWCLEQRAAFGVVLGRKDGIAPAGCGAEIVEVIKKYDDGRMDILTVGRERFRVLEVFDDLPYLQVRVEFLPDEEAPPDLAVTEHLLAVFGDVHRLVHDRDPDAPGPREGVSLAYHVAAALPLDLDQKQRLLEMRSEAARQEALVTYLDAWAGLLQKRQAARRKAADNGRGR